MLHTALVNDPNYIFSEAFIEAVPQVVILLCILSLSGSQGELDTAPITHDSAGELVFNCVSILVQGYYRQRYSLDDSGFF